MKTIICSLIMLFVLNSIAFCQEKRLALSLQGGVYRGADYIRITDGKAIAIEMSYYLSNRLILMSHVNYGKNRYWEELSFSSTIWADGTNSYLNNIHVGLMIGYQAKAFKKFNLKAFTGISSFTESEKVPYQIEPGSIIQYTSTGTDLAFPVKVVFDIEIKNTLLVGLAGGFYIHPDYPIIGYHFGPQVGWRL